MNKLLILLLACLTLTASGAPTLEIFEFGTKAPVVSKKLSGKSEKISTKNS